MRSANSYTRLGVAGIVAVLVTACAGYVHAQANVGIGTTTPNASAILDLTSTNSGLLPPRMTHAQMNAIPATVATGDFVFCTDSTAFLTPSTYYYYNGSAWVPFMGNYLANYLAGNGVIYGPTSQQNTLTAGATPIFNVAYAAASGASVTEYGAEIEANASGATAGSATGLTLTAVGSGTGTQAYGLVVSATGAAGDTTVDATSEIAENGAGIGTTSTDGLVLQNLTPATLSVTQQYSPRIDLTGTAYNSTGAASQTDKFIVENQPQTAAGTTSTNLVFSDIINGSASTQDAVLSSNANLLLGQTSNTEGSLSLAASSAAFMTTIEPSTTTPTSTFIYNLPAQICSSAGRTDPLCYLGHRHGALYGQPAMGNLISIVHALYFVGRYSDCDYEYHRRNGRIRDWSGRYKVHTYCDRPHAYHHVRVHLYRHGWRRSVCPDVLWNRYSSRTRSSNNRHGSWRQNRSSARWGRSCGNSAIYDRNVPGPDCGNTISGSMQPFPPTPARPRSDKSWLPQQNCHNRMEHTTMKNMKSLLRSITKALASMPTTSVIVVLWCFLSVFEVRAQTNVGIGTFTPNASALLDLTSTTQGLLPPRMTHAQMNAIPATVATADFVYCTDSTGFLTPSTYYYYNGSAWVPFEGNYIANYFTTYGVIYGPTSQQNSLAAGATPLFNVAYAPASGASVTDYGAEIESLASGATAGSATGLTILALGSGTGTKATGLLVSASGAAGDTSLYATGLIAENNPGIATTSTDGLALQNLTAATSGTPQQYSPRIDLTGSAWNSTSGASETDKFIIENQPQTVAGTTTTNLVFSDMINGGAISQDAILSSSANLLLGQTGNTQGSLSLAYSSAGFMTTFQPSLTTPTSSFIYNLPAQTAAPLAGQVLSVTSVTGTGPYTVNLQWGTSSSSYLHYVSSVDSVAAITSTTGEMGGLGSSIYFTPVVTGHMLIIMSGNLYSNVNGDEVTSQLVYGTGTAPAHGAAITGTVVSGKAGVDPVGSNHTECAPFMLETYVAMTVGTQYWIDAACAAQSGTCRLGQVLVTATELP